MKEEVVNSLNNSLVSNSLVNDISQSQLNGDSVTNKRGLIDGKQTLLQHISALYLSDTTSDIKLKVDGLTIPAHRCIVANRSEYFYEQIYGSDDARKTNAPQTGANWDPKRQTLDVLGTTANALKQVLKYLYCGELYVDNLDLELIIDVLSLSHRCKLNAIVFGISEYLKDIVSIDNVWTIYTASTLFDETSPLAEYCLRFMDRSATKMLHHESTYDQSVANLKMLIKRSTFETPEVEKFKAIYKWINSNPELDSKDLVSCISLTKLAQEELLHVVRPTHLVSDSQILDAIQPKRKRVSLDTSTNTEAIKMEAIEFTPKFTIKTMKHETDNVGYYYSVEFPEAYELNHIKLRLSELITGKGEYSYYVEASSDNENWTKIVDYSKYICRSWQKLYFATFSTKYLKIVGTRTDGKVADIIIDSFDCSYSHNCPKQENSFVIPNEDIANLDCGTRIRYPINRHDLYLLHSTQRYAYFIPVRNFGEDLKKNAFNIQFAQPYLLDSLEFKVYSKDQTDSYKFYVEISGDEKQWERIFDREKQPSRGLQLIKFDKRPVSFVRIVGTGGVGTGCSKFLGCSAFRCPSISISLDD